MGSSGTPPGAGALAMTGALMKGALERWLASGRPSHYPRAVIALGVRGRLAQWRRCSASADPGAQAILVVGSSRCAFSLRPISPFFASYAHRSQSHGRQCRPMDHSPNRYPAAWRPASPGLRPCQARRSGRRRARCDQGPGHENPRWSPSNRDVGPVGHCETPFRGSCQHRPLSALSRARYLSATPRGSHRWKYSEACPPPHVLSDGLPRSGICSPTFPGGSVAVLIRASCAPSL